MCTTYKVSVCGLPIKSIPDPINALSYYVRVHMNTLPT